MGNSQRHYDATGPAHAQPIVLVHASGQTRAMWLPQVEALAGEFRVIAPDLPGHGTRAAEPFTLAGAVAAISAATAAEARGPALLVGLSIGGYVAMLFAAHHPARTVALALCGCSVGFDGYLGVMTRASAGAYVLLTHLLPPPVVAWGVRRHARAYASQLRRTLPARYAEPQIAAGLYVRDWGTALLQVTAASCHASLQRYPGPVLVLNGEHDKYNRRYEGAHVAAARDARLQIIPGADHLANLSNPEAFSAAIRAFARSLA